MSQIIVKIFKHAVKSWTRGMEVTLSSQAYQMELEVDRLIGTSTPAMGYSRSRGVGLAMRLTWCLGEPRRKKFQLEVGSPRVEEFPSFLAPSLRNQALEVR